MEFSKQILLERRSTVRVIKVVAINDIEKLDIFQI